MGKNIKAYSKLSKRDTLPDLANLGKADNLLRQMRYGLNYDPLTELVALSRDKETTVSEKIRIATELLSYTAPKMRAVQVNPDMGEVININIAYPEVGETKEKLIPLEVIDLDAEEEVVDEYQL